MVECAPAWKRNRRIKTCQKLAAGEGSRKREKVREKLEHVAEGGELQVVAVFEKEKRRLGRKKKPDLRGWHSRGVIGERNKKVL